MKILQNIKSENIIGLDIETVRVSNEFEEVDEGYQSSWEYKNKQDGVVPDYGELEKMWKKNTALYAEFSKVCAVSLSFLHEGKLYCKEFYGENEEDLLKSLSITLNNISTKSKNNRLVGHAAKYFDYPYLCKRFVINGLDIPSILDSTALKPWEQMNLCTNELWKMGGTGAGSSLQALCNVLKIPISKVDLVGDEIGKAYFDGEFERIGRYCSYDTIATFNIIRRFKKEPIFQFNEVEYVVQYSDKVKIEELEVDEVPLPQKIYKAESISETDKNKIKEKLTKKKLTKKDKEVLEDILTSVYINNTMFYSDRPNVKERKREEIKQLLN